VVALADLKKGQTVQLGPDAFALVTDVPAKHQFSAADLAVGDLVRMHGVLVGEAIVPIGRGNTRDGNDPLSRRIRGCFLWFRDLDGGQMWPKTGSWGGHCQGPQID